MRPLAACQVEIELARLMTQKAASLIDSGQDAGTAANTAKPAAAADAAIAIIKKKKVKTNGKVSGTPSVLLTPVWITTKNYKLLFTEGFLKKKDVCKGSYAKYCK